MPEYLAPGVFIEEIERGPKPIEAAATSTAAFIGVTERGSLTPALVTSFSEYSRAFGSQSGDGEYMTDAMKSFFDNGGARCYVSRIAPRTARFSSVTQDDLVFKSAGPGTFGNNIVVRISPSSTTKFVIEDGDENSTEKPIGFRLELFYWTAIPDNYLAVIDNPSLANQPRFTEVFDDLSLEPSSANYWDKRINGGNSVLIEMLVDNSATSVFTEADIPTADSPLVLQLSNGQGANSEVAPVDFDAQLTDPITSSIIPMGTAALELDPYREVAIVYAPFFKDRESYNTVASKVKTHCENNGFRFAVIDSAPNVSQPTNLNPRDLFDSKYAAFYYPWIYASDPVLGGRKKIPPGAATCGVYARTDNARGVFKAPANETVSGALSLEYDINQATQEVLNPKGVNVIRQFPGRGIRIWGARTLSSDPLWKYVNVRRLFIFLEASIYNSTQWVVFEPNDQRLWARIKQTITLFLRTQWQEGALFGATEDEAFSVNVGRETMTQDDILNGRLIVEIGIAPVRPAEFVIFRIFQKTSESN